MLKIKRALVSVSDKSGLVDFVKVLVGFGVEIISTGGTVRVLKKAGIPVVEISDYTGFPEMLDGRVKTLHPKIHAGLLSLRNNAAHMKEVRKQRIGLIDMVVVNLYPFQKTIKKKGVSLQEAIENIDIGGPSMLRSAAKNHQSVAVVSNAKFYPSVAAELKRNNGRLTKETLESLAVEVFRLTSDYDCSICDFLAAKLTSSKAPAEALSMKLEKVCALRYGENPHQRGGLYKEVMCRQTPLISAKQLHGKQLSFNNYLDLNSAFELIRDFKKPAACIIKHTNPTGVAEASSLARAYSQAWQTDVLSAFGGIVGLNRKVDVVTAKAILKSGFLECILAPGYEKQALELLRRSRKNLRLLEVAFGTQPASELDFKKINGGFLIQESDTLDIRPQDLKIVTRKKPTKKERAALFFAWKVAKHVKSNAIVLASATKTVGIGMGQTSRVDSVFMAVKRAGRRARGAVLASDAFLPKADNVALAKKAGIKAIIQPGGSIQDKEVILAAEEANIAMVFTGTRHFKH